MIVILHQRTCQASADTAKNDLLAAFTGNVEVTPVEAGSAAIWPAPAVEWDDLLIIVFDSSPFPDPGNQFITEYLNQRGDDAMLLPVAVDSTSQKPPKPSV